MAIEVQSFPTPWSRTALRAYIGEAGFLVCEHRRRLLGYVLAGIQMPSLFDRLERLTLGILGSPPPAQTVGHIMNIAVHPDFRGCGLGRKLLRAGLAHLRALSADRVQLEVRVDNAPAIQLYASEGFHTVRVIKGYYQNGDDAYLMEKVLSPGPAAAGEAAP